MDAAGGIPSAEVTREVMFAATERALRHQHAAQEMAHRVFATHAEPPCRCTAASVTALAACMTLMKQPGIALAFRWIRLPRHPRPRFLGSGVENWRTNAGSFA